MPKRLSKKRAITLLEKADKIAKEDAKRPKRTKIVPAAGAGDILASGGGSATYGMPNISQEKWDAIFNSEDTDEKKSKRRVRKSKK
jgi:hypothetical protein